jgi:hypothetical protein
LIFFWTKPQADYSIGKTRLSPACGRAIRCIFCSATASQKDAATIPFAGQKYVQKTTYKTHPHSVISRSHFLSLRGGTTMQSKTSPHETRIHLHYYK